MLPWLDTGVEPNISTRSHDILNWSREQVEQILGGEIKGSMKIAEESQKISLVSKLEISIEEYIDFIEGNEFDSSNISVDRPNWAHWK